jgi:hypothetical protein
MTIKYSKPSNLEGLSSCNSHTFMEFTDIGAAVHWKMGVMFMHENK